MSNQRGSFLMETMIALFASSVLLIAALSVYAGAARQLARAEKEWNLHWEMKVLSHEWKQGLYSPGRYQFEGYAVDIEEVLLEQNVREGVITIRWETSKMPQKRQLRVYKMDTF